MRNLILLGFLLSVFFSFQAKCQTTVSMELRPGPENGLDAEVRTDMNYPIWYDDDFIANCWTVYGNPFLQRSLLKFDLSSVPGSATIVSARLSLFCNTSSGHQQLHSGYNSSYLLMITSNWEQTEVVWDNQPSTTMENAVLLPGSDSQIQDYPEIDITNQVDYWYKNPDHNFGFMFRLVEEELYNSLVFASSNHLDPEKRPLLTIEYTFCESPNPNFSYFHGEEVNTVNFTVAVDSSTSYFWDFGNGFYSDLPQPTFTFQETGDYNVCLTAMNECDTITYCEVIRICETPDPNFEYSSDGFSVSFHPVDNSEAAIYLWDFGDGFFSYLKDPVHFFNEAGNYQVCLTISNECDTSSFCQEVILSTVGINEQFSEQVEVFPNPSSGRVCVRNAEMSTRLYSLKLFGIRGDLVYELSDIAELNNPEGFYYDFSFLGAGIYHLVINSDKGVFNKKIILTNTN